MGAVKPHKRKGDCPAGRAGPLTDELRAALELAAAQARASGVPLEEVLAVCRGVYEKKEGGQG